MGKMYALDDLEQLDKGVRKAVDSNLAPGEVVKVVVRGNAKHALVATDRRVFVFDWGLFSKKLTTFDYRNVTGVGIESGPLTGTIRIQAAEVAGAKKRERHGGNELIVTRNGLDRARERVTVLRHLISEFHAPAAARAPVPDAADLLRKLGQLRDAGVVTADEFNAKKAELLARM